MLGVFGHPHYREGQKETLEALFSGNDCLTILPTGCGKSFIFQAFAISQRAENKASILVISPLIALMKEQVAKLNSRFHLDPTGVGVGAGAPIAVHLGPESTREEICASYNGEYVVVYMSPERLDFKEISSAGPDVRAVIVDEAHCVSVHGNSFRPAYRTIGKWRKDNAPDIPLLALTASATSNIICDCEEALALRPKYFFWGGCVARRNICIKFAIKEGIASDAATLLNAVRPAIVYVHTRRETERIAARLRALGAKAVSYHAGMSREDRSEAQNSFQESTADVIVATLSFGMGIDKKDVRSVIHYGLPKSLEAYLQEAGRAGRDGEDACALCLWSANDGTLLRKLAAEDDNPRISLRALQLMEEFAATRECRHVALEKHFETGRPSLARCGKCDTCGSKPELRITPIMKEVLLSIKDTPGGRKTHLDIMTGKRKKRNCLVFTPVKASRTSIVQAQKLLHEHGYLKLEHISDAFGPVERVTDLGKQCVADTEATSFF